MLIMSHGFAALKWQQVSITGLINCSLLDKVALQGKSSFALKANSRQKNLLRPFVPTQSRFSPLNLRKWDNLTDKFKEI